MTTFRIEVETRGREMYVVEADTFEEACANWSEGTLFVSEVLDGEVNEDECEVLNDEGEWETYMDDFFEDEDEDDD